VAGFQMMSDVGSIIGPMVAGLLLDAAGFPVAFTAGAVVTALALVLAVRMPETLPRGTADAAA
jgi:MFS family permease